MTKPLGRTFPIAAAELLEDDVEWRGQDFSFLYEVPYRYMQTHSDTVSQAELWQERTKNYEKFPTLLVVALTDTVYLRFKHISLAVAATYQSLTATFRSFGHSHSVDKLRVPQREGKSHD